MNIKHILGITSFFVVIFLLTFLNIKEQIRNNQKELQTRIARMECFSLLKGEEFFIYPDNKKWCVKGKETYVYFREWIKQD